MSEITNNLNQQVYNIHDGDTLLNQVTDVVCVLMPRAMVAGGFSEQGDLLTLRYNDYKKDLPTWILDFFEHQFIDEPLMAKPEKIKALLIATKKGMVIPDTLYDEAAAEKWMKKIFFVEENELISAHEIEKETAKYVYSWPAPMQSLVTRYFPESEILPLPIYQFYKPVQAELVMQCCVTCNQVYATFYKNQQLKWHQIFYYDTAEDIAYHIKLLCKQSNVDADKLSLQCLAVNEEVSNITMALSQYFPLYNDGTHRNERGSSWNGAILLLQQLYACVL